MKILILHNHYIFAGGEDVVVQSEMELLKKHGHEIIFYERSNKEFDTWSLPEKITFVLKHFFWSSKTYHEIRTLIQKERPDIAHIHNTLFVMSSSAYSACFDEGLPVVQTLHNYRFICPNGVFFRDNRICEDCLGTKGLSAVGHRCVHHSFLLSLMYLRLLCVYRKNKIFEKVISLCIAPSEFCRRKFIETGVFPKEKVSVKLNFLSHDPQPRATVGRYVLYVGALHPYKGIETLLKAWQYLDDIALKIVGAGEGFSFYKNQHASHKQIEFVGSVGFQEVLRFIKESAFIVVPSECYETFSRVIMEAFACGVPVIASGIGAVQERIRDHETGVLFEPRNAVDLAVKVRFLFYHREEIRRMGEKARQEFYGKFDAETNYEILTQIYEKAQCVARET